ncbi:MAG: aminopeptidase [Prevotella sp.]|nr:aminopeptidase [Prevotella sp.]
MLTKGVSKELADQRKAIISHVSYKLTFNIPSESTVPVSGKVVISFNLATKTDVVLDYTGEFSGQCLINGKKREAYYSDEHIVLPMKRLNEGTNVVEMEFTSRDDALNRHKDYLYTLFVPDHARSAFPCFDQPDLRARFETTLNVPEGWKTIASDGSNPIPTYLYSFVAGNYQEKRATREGRPMRALYLERDPKKVAQLDKVFDEAAEALKWLENYTGITCPFAEYGLVILPGYQFGGMEHPGAIQVNDRRIFLEENPTQEEELSRMELIAHETAHLWFGDVVSLKWFEDVWMKEVFANFMASKITRRQFNKVDHTLNFIRTYQTRAIAIDRTEGTHPIAQQLANLNHASLLYDNIIYDKAPVMMRMLEETMGAVALQNGLRSYLQKNFFRNASWEDLITALENSAPGSAIRQFSEVWVKQKGMPTIHTSYREGQLIITQNDPYGRGLCWRQKFQVQLIYDLGTSRTVTIDMDKPTVTMKLSSKPSFIIPNWDGLGYGRFTLDDEYVKKLPLRLITTRNDLNRYSLLLLIHENYLMGKVNPAYFGELYRMMMREKNPLVMSTAIDHMFKIAFDLTTEQRSTLELCMLDLLGENKTDVCRQLIIRKLAANATSPEVLKRINQIWESKNDPLFNDRDYMEMAYRLAIMHPDRWQEYINRQSSRLKDPTLKAEFDYVSRACNPSENAQLQLFNGLLKPENRQHEPWALRMLRLLSADVREPVNNTYIPASLTSLQYLQQTSDIFFPGNWMKALLASHKSLNARKEVEKFLQQYPNYPQNLRNKILEAAWPLMKQVYYEETGNARVIRRIK